MKRLFVTLFIALTALFSALPVSAATAPADDEIVSRDDGFVPEYTLNPDPSLKEHGGFELSRGDAVLFYTETTALALLAGYLILFKAKGIPKHEKMHRRARTNG